MRKLLLVVLSLVAVGAAVGVPAFYWGTQAASRYWLGQYLRQVAREAWILERAKSIAAAPSSPADFDWLDREARDAERVLAHPEYAEIVEQDQEIRRLRKRAADLRQKGTAPNSASNEQVGLAE